MVVLLKSFAGIGVTDRHHEETQAEGQHDEIQHEVLLVALVSVRDHCVFQEGYIATDQYQLTSDRVS